MNKDKNSIQIYLVSHPSKARFNENIISTLRKYYFFEIKNIKLDEIKNFIGSKIHVLIFDGIRPEKINYSEISNIVKVNANLYTIVIYKTLNQKRATLCYEKHIDYIVDSNYDDRYLVAYFSSILKRKSRKYHIERIKTFKNLKIDYLMHEIYEDESIVDTTSKEFKLLKVLIENSDVFLRKDVVFEKVWGYEKNDSKYLDQYIYRIRKKFKTLNLIVDQKNGIKLI